MAHTLKAYYYTDPATAVTVDFYSAVADNDGIAVDAWQMGVPGVEQARNNSLYSDSPRPVYSKHGTVTDTLTVTVRGSTNTALYTNLHLLAKLGEYARTWHESPVRLIPAYLEMKPGGSSAGEVMYAVIYDARVELPPDWANTQDSTLEIEDVTVTIERGIWQRYPFPPAGNDDLSYSPANVDAASSDSYDIAIGGDTTALYKLVVGNSWSAGGTFNRFIVGYRSEAMGGSNYASLGKKEAESQTNGTDTSDAADATASAGNKVTCTFGTATIATRLSGTGIPYGVHRVFARMKITSTAVATVNVKYQDTASASAVYVANSSVSVSSTSWFVYDLGIVRYYDTTTAVMTTPTSTGVWALDALLASGTGNLDIDYLFFMPTEGYLTASGFSMVYASPLQFVRISNRDHPIIYSTFHESGVSQRMSTLQYTASFNPLPGKFALYWLVGTDTGTSFDCNVVASSASIMLQTTPRYIMPSVV